MVQVNIYKTPYGFYKVDDTEDLGEELERLAKDLIISYEDSENLGFAFWYVRKKTQSEDEEHVRSFKTHEEGTKILKELIKEVSESE